MNDIVRDPRGRWLPGNPGRPQGSRNKLAERVLDTFLQDFSVHGADALVRVREDRPADYWRIATQLLPQQVLVNAFVSTDEGDNPLSALSPAEKRAAAQMLLDQIAAERAKVIEGDCRETEARPIDQRCGRRVISGNVHGQGRVQELGA